MTRDGKAWLNQKQLDKLFGTSKQNISNHIASVLKNKGLDKYSTVKCCLIVVSNGKKYKVI